LAYRQILKFLEILFFPFCYQTITDELSSLRGLLGHARMWNTGRFAAQINGIHAEMPLNTARISIRKNCTGREANRLFFA
jgi:hypothetical protein